MEPFADENLNPLLSQDKAQALMQSGALSQDTYNKMYAPAPPPVDVPAPTVPPPDDLISNIATSVNAEKKAAEDARKLEADDMAGKQLKLKEDLLQYQIKNDLKEGATPDAVRKKYAKDLEEINASKKPVMQNASMRTADLPGGVESAPQGQLAADVGQTIQVDPLARQKAMMDMLAPDQAGYDIQQQALLQSAKVGAAKGAEQAALQGRIISDDEARVRNVEANNALRNDRLDAEATKLNDAVGKVQAMAVDPNNYAKMWANKDTGDKIATGISLFLGAFGSSGHNTAVPIIQKAIDADIAAQKANIAKDGDVLGIQKGIYNEMVSRFKDQRLAEEGTRVAYLDNAIMKTKQIESKYQAPELKAKAAMLIGELEQKKLDAQGAFKAQLMKTMPSILDPNNPNALNEDQRERYVPGMGVALTKDDAKELKAFNSDAVAAKGAISRLRQIADIPGRSFSPELRAEADTTSKMLQGLLRTSVLGPGTVQQAERDMLEKMIADPTSITGLSSTQKKRLEVLVQRIDAGVAAKAKAYGLSTVADRLGFKQASK